MLLLALLALPFLLLLALVGRPLFHIARAAYTDFPPAPPLPPGHLDDASHLNETTATQPIAVAADSRAAEQQLRQLLQRAAQEHRIVTPAGARHSMGGHTFYPGGISIDMRPFAAMNLDETSDVLHVGAGALWSDVLRYLNERGRSVAVMQSNNSFTVGGSISVNCHGWPTNLPPIASTVEAFRIMTADGSIRPCSRTENAELFRLALGGYGLFGIILDVDLRVVPNEQYAISSIDTDPEHYAAIHQANVTSAPDVAMAFARMDVAPSNFLGSMILKLAHRTTTAPSATAASPLQPVPLAGFRRAIFRGSVGSDYGKGLRWWAEDHVEPWLRSGTVARNDLLNVGVDLFENRDPAATEILHEYFVAPDHFAAFVARVREIVPRHRADLLNVTVRDVQRDDDTFLRYADQRMFCLVMLFHQPRTAQGDAAMEALTQDMISAVLEENGRYYLPYRLHATPEQFARAYPQAKAFFEKKQQYDPAGLFQNAFSRKYNTARAAGAPPGL